MIQILTKRTILLISNIILCRTACSTQTFSCLINSKNRTAFINTVSIIQITFNVPIFFRIHQSFCPQDQSCIIMVSGQRTFCHFTYLYIFFCNIFSNYNNHIDEKQKKHQMYNIKASDRQNFHFFICHPNLQSAVYQSLLHSYIIFKTKLFFK